MEIQPTEEIHKLVKREKNRDILLQISNLAIDLEYVFIKSLAPGEGKYELAYSPILADIPDPIFYYACHCSTKERINLIKLAIERIEYLDKLEDAASPRTRSFTNILPLNNS